MSFFHYVFNFKTKCFQNTFLVWSFLNLNILLYYRIDSFLIYKYIFSTLASIYTPKCHIERFNNYQSVLRSRYTQARIRQVAGCTHVYSLHVYRD